MINEISLEGIADAARAKMFTCPGCGWTVKTPFGEDDILEHSMMHTKKRHPEMANTPKTELKKMAKDAQGQCGQFD